MKRSIMDEVGILLLRHGYTVKTVTRTSFDLVARRGSKILLLKVLEDANSISGEDAASMQNIASYTAASPLIIAGKAGHPLADGVVYVRFGVYACNYGTFSSCLENRFPVVISTRAGFTADVIGERLRDRREREGYSLGAISRKVGVSKRMIVKYESNSADVSLRSAIALGKIFGRDIFSEIDVFRVAKEMLNDHPSVIVRKYDELGFRATDARKAPFDVVARMERELILTDVEGKDSRPNPHLESLQQLLGADALVILDDRQKKKRAGKPLPSIRRKDFLGLESARELLKLLREFEQA